MKTLLVDCYRRDAGRRLYWYHAAIRPFSDCQTVNAGAVSSHFDPSGFQAVVLSGSQMMLSEEEPPAGLVSFVRSLRIPVLGICFGHQLLARSTGVPVRTGKLIERVETIELIEPSPLFERLGDRFEMLESHREFVAAESLAAAGWQLLARSESCPVEAMCCRERPLFAVQFHPERSGEPGRQIFASFYENVVLPFWGGQFGQQPQSDQFKR